MLKPLNNNILFVGGTYASGGELYFSEIGNSLSINNQNIVNISNEIIIYPNPSNGQVSIKGIVADILTITNLNGQVILTKNVSGQTQTNLDLSTLNAGVYFVQATANGTISTSRVIVK